MYFGWSDPLNKYGNSILRVNERVELLHYFHHKITLITARVVIPKWRLCEVKACIYSVKLCTLWLFFLLHRYKLKKQQLFPHSKKVLGWNLLEAFLQYVLDIVSIFLWLFSRCQKKSVQVCVCQPFGRLGPVQGVPHILHCACWEKLQPPTG